LREFNAAVQTARTVRSQQQGRRCTRGLAVNKSNWANTIDEPPFEAYGVSCGVTFTFGGLKVNSSAQVMDIDDRLIPGLFAAGEMVGGLFYSNYPAAAASPPARYSARSPELPPRQHHALEFAALRTSIFFSTTLDRTWLKPSGKAKEASKRQPASISQRIAEHLVGGELCRHAAPAISGSETVDARYAGGRLGRLGRAGSGAVHGF
jgi:hypothetical protein